MRKKFIIISLIISVMCTLATVPNVSAAENVARGKDAFASSKYTENDVFGPQNVTNGNYYDIWSMGSVTLTGVKAGYQYVAVDLGEKYLIDTVKAVTRRGLDDANARNKWFIQLANEREFSDAVTVETAEKTVGYEEDYVFNVEEEKGYRYVRVCSPNYFTVAELEVYGEVYDPATMERTVAFSDTEDKFYNGAAAVLSSLGIMNGTSKYMFDGEKMLTRAQAAKIITEFMNCGTEKANVQYFSDIDKEHWAADYIYTAMKNGIVSSAEEFRPDEYVSNREFLKMIICAMGYSDYLERMGGYSIGVPTVANELRLTSKVNVGIDSYLNRGMAAMTVYNALCGYMYNVSEYRDGVLYMKHSDKTVLEERFNKKTVTGIMTANDTTSLISEISEQAKRIQIDGKVYTDPTEVTHQWIGKSICVLVDADNEQRVETAWVNLSNTKTVKVYDSSFCGWGGNTYEYYSSDDKKGKIKIDKNVYVVKNGSALTDWTKDDFSAPDGYLEFIDNNNDGNVEAVVIYEPQIVIADSVSIGNGKVTISDVSGAVISAENYNYISISKNGKNTTAGKVVQNNVLKLYISKNKKSVIVDVIDNVVSGTIESIYDDGAVISGKETEYSEYYKKNYNDTDIPEIGKSVEALLDGEDRLIWITDGSVSDAKSVIGFVTKAYQPESGLEPAELRIFSQYGSFGNYKLADKVKVDGKQYSSNTVADKILNGSLILENEFVMYTLNGDDEITVLDTENYDTAVEPNSKIVKSDKELGTNVVYIPDSNGFYSFSWLVKPMRNDSMVFSIPVVNGVPAGDDYEKKYTVSKKVDNIFYRLTQITEKTAFYGEDENGYPTFGVKYVPYSYISESGLSAVSKHSAFGIIITGISKVITENETETYSIKGFNIASGAAVEYIVSDDLKGFYESDKIQRERTAWLDDERLIVESRVDAAEINDYSDSLENLKKGDIIRVETDDKTITAMERVFDSECSVGATSYVPSGGNYYSAGDDFPLWPTTDFRLIYGSADGIKKGIFYVNTPPKSGETENQIQKFDYKTMTNLFVFEDGKVTKYSASALQTKISDGTNTVIYAKSGKPTTVILYR